MYQETWFLVPSTRCSLLPEIFREPARNLTCFYFIFFVVVWHCSSTIPNDKWEPNFGMGEWGAIPPAKIKMYWSSDPCVKMGTNWTLQSTCKSPSISNQWSHFTRIYRPSLVLICPPVKSSHNLSLLCPPPQTHQRAENLRRISLKSSRAATRVHYLQSSQ